jgi:coenzyme F420-reducing hydrogenase alpha subunit
LTWVELEITKGNEIERVESIKQKVCGVCKVKR